MTIKIIRVKGNFCESKERIEDGITLGIASFPRVSETCELDRDGTNSQNRSSSNSASALH